MNKLQYFFHNPRLLLIGLLKRFNFVFPDKLYLSLIYRLSMGEKLNLRDPKTYNEKLNWLKLYYRDPLYSRLVDKYKVKSWVADRIGEQYVIPTYGVWDSFEEIDFDSLPNEFVLKTTHGGSNQGVVICHDKKSFDFDQARKKINSSLRRSAGSILREWPYKKVERRIIAEKYLVDSSTNDLYDYKFFCFNGEVKALFIATGRQDGEVKFDYFDSNFNHLDLRQSHPMSGLNFQKPKTFDNMKSIASRLSTGMPHVRCDLYEVDGNIYFGELTFFHHGGITPFHPKKWDLVFGDWLHLPPRNH